MEPRITSIRQLRREFWEAHPKLSRKKITNYSGNGKMHCTDTRCAWSDWKEMLSRNGEISQELMQTATL